jgi:DinB superfamily
MDEGLGRSVAACLEEQLLRTHEVVCARLQGLTDAEFFWQPVPGSWTIRPLIPGEEHLNGAGEWIYDYAIPDPEPPPFTTIAWRLVHLGSINDMFFEHVFGPGRRDYPDQRIPHEPASAIAWWEQGLLRFADKLAEVDDPALERAVTVPWGVTQSVERWVQTIVHENTHHGAEIGVLRDLYRDLP